MDKICIVTAIGVGTNTTAMAFRKMDDAISYAMGLEGEYDMMYVENVGKNCRKGFSNRAQCDIEIEIHETELP